MSLQIISKSDNIKIFIREYYLGQKTWIKIDRMVGGPLVIMCGLFLLNKSGKFAVACGGFSLVFGIYYSLKPLLFIIFRKSLFKASELELTLNSEELRGKREGVESIFALNYFQSVVRHPFYYRLTTKKAGVIYLIADQLTQEERQILDNRLTT